MVERRPWLDALSHLVLILGVLIIALPVYITFVASTRSTSEIIHPPMPISIGSHMVENYQAALSGEREGPGSKAAVGHMMTVSLVMALAIAIGKIAISLLSAFAIVYFRFPGRMLFFWAVFITLMLPVEVRIGPTYQVVADLGLLNSYAGLTIPLIASATATFLFRQFFLTVPEELTEASRMDGASPMRFFIDVLLPLSRTNMAALGTIMFVWAWNQYLWPLLVTTDSAHGTAVTQLKELIPQTNGTPDWHTAMAGTLIVMLPPLVVVILMQRWFVRGLVATEK